MLARSSMLVDSWRPQTICPLPRKTTRAVGSSVPLDASPALRLFARCPRTMSTAACPSTTFIPRRAQRHCLKPPKDGQSSPSSHAPHSFASPGLFARCPRKTGTADYPSTLFIPYRAQDRCLKSPKKEYRRCSSAGTLFSDSSSGPALTSLLKPNSTAIGLPERSRTNRPRASRTAGCPSDFSGSGTLTITVPPKTELARHDAGLLPTPKSIGE